MHLFVGGKLPLLQFKNYSSGEDLEDIGVYNSLVESEVVKTKITKKYDNVLLYLKMSKELQSWCYHHRFSHFLACLHL